MSRTRSYIARKDWFVFLASFIELRLLIARLHCSKFKKWIDSCSTLMKRRSDVLSTQRPPIQRVPPNRRTGTPSWVGQSTRQSHQTQASNLPLNHIKAHAHKDYFFLPYIVIWETLNSSPSERRYCSTFHWEIRPPARIGVAMVSTVSPDRTGRRWVLLTSTPKKNMRSFS